MAIDADIIPGGGSGGVEQVIIGLVSALGKLAAGEEEYLLVTHHSYPDWLRPYLGENEKIIPRPWNQIDRKRARITGLKKIAGPIVKTVARPLYDWVGTHSSIEISRSDGFWESLGAEVIHFPTQGYTISAVPSIYNPHDLQHLHFPDFFDASQVRYREVLYRTGCEYATAVGVHSRWVKQDIVDHYQTEPNKIFVIPWGAATQVYGPVSEERLSAIRRSFNLPGVFAMYPAKTWPHKNHIRLLQALALLRDRDQITVNLVCPGTKSENWSAIDSAIREMKLENQVWFTGFVEPEELRAFYLMARFVVIPTLFEAGSMPMLEGWREGIPVACSKVTSLPEQAGDAALLFDPLSIEEIADAMRRLTTEAELRDALRRKGYERVKLFSWERTARMYRALYRKTGGRNISAEDKKLLQEAMS